MECLNEVEDPRQASNGTRHDFQDILLIGMVAKRLAGQCCRFPGDDTGIVVASEWNHADPMYGHAILRLLDAAEIDAGVPA